MCAALHPSTKSGNTLIWGGEKKKKHKKNKREHLSNFDLKAGRKSVRLKAAGHGRAAKTQPLEQDGEKGKQGLCKPAKQLIIGSYY